MKRCALAAGALMCWMTAASAQTCQVSGHETLQAAFAPQDDVEGLIAEEIRKARRQVLVQAYLLTNRKVAAALIRAHRRGIDVRVLADAQRLEKSEGSLLPELSEAGIPVWLQTKYQNAHDKVVLVDPEMPESTVITGSFNFTWTAQHKNAENILLVRGNACLASRFLGNWLGRQAEASFYRK